MKIAITGGAGFIGTHLTRAYLDAGHDVLVIDSLACKAQRAIDPRARFYHVDIRDGKLRTILQQERPDLVSHCASQQDNSPTPHALADADVHVRGLLNVLDSCVSASVKKVVFASGGNNLYGRREAGQLLLTEDAPLHPQSANDISKIAGEWYVRHYTQQFGLKHTILRYADVYGESETLHSPHPLNYFITMLQAMRRPIIRGTGDEIRDHIYIKDVLQANLCLLKHGENQTLHISTGQGSSLKQLYYMVAQLMGSTLEPIYLSGGQVEAPPITLDNTRAKRILNWYPMVTLTEGICKMLEKYQERREPPRVSEPIVITREVLAVEANLTKV